VSNSIVFLTSKLDPALSRDRCFQKLRGRAEASAGRMTAKGCAWRDHKRPVMRLARPGRLQRQQLGPAWRHAARDNAADSHQIRSSANVRPATMADMVSFIYLKLAAAPRRNYFVNQSAFVTLHYITLHYGI